MFKENDPKQEENKIKLFLEASLLRKVDSIVIKPINKSLDKLKLNKEEISYNVWLYNIDILKEIVPSVIRNNEYNYVKSQMTQGIKFKLGSIIWDDLEKSNDKLKYHLSQSNINLSNLNSNPNSYYVVLGQTFIGNSQTKVMTDEDPRDSEIKINPGDNTEVYYLNGKQDDINKGISTYHWFLVRDNTKLVFNYLVNFTLDTNEIKCYNPNCNSNSTELKYCHNDQKYFCSVCVEDFHNKQSYNTLKKHIITNAITYSINYTSNCSTHKLKQLEFFCYNCNALYCTKCFDVGEVHYGLKNHDVRFINDVFASFEVEMSSLTSRIREMVNYIDEEVEKRNNSSKEIGKIYKNTVQEITERLAKAHEELENEILYRSTYLASVSVEIQRIITEIDSKIYFLKHQFYNADQSTYISMYNMFTKYMKEELIPNLDLLCNLSFEQITTNLYHVEKKDNDNLKN
jgi:hypothetical protein